MNVIVQELRMRGVIRLALCLLAVMCPLVCGEDAQASAATPGQPLWDLMFKGGAVMWLILIASVVGLAYFFERIIELRKTLHCPEGFDKDVVHVVDTRGVDAGLVLCLEKRSSLSRALYASLLRYGSHRQEMESGVHDEIKHVRYDLKRNTRYIGAACLTTALLGFLGAALQLMEAFEISALGAQDASVQFASHAAQAMLPLSFGLMSAVPLVLMYFLARWRADDLVRRIEERAIDAVVTLDRKARKSIQRVEDIEEGLETKTMPAAAMPAGIPTGLDMDLQDADLEKAIKTSVATPAQLPAVSMPATAQRAVSSSGFQAALAGPPSGIGQAISTGAFTPAGGVAAPTLIPPQEKKEEGKT